MKSELSWRQQLVILIIIFLLHSLVIISMFMFALYHQEPKERFIPEEPTILFEDNKPVPPEQNWVMTTPPTPTSLSSLSAISTSEQSFDQQTPDLDRESNEGSQEKIELSPQTINDAIALAQQVLTQNEQQTSIIKDKNPQKENVSPHQKVAIHPSQQTLQTTMPPVQHKPTMAQLAQGFVNHLEQIAAMRVESNQSDTASIDQLKHLHYIEKIINCLVNAYKINRGNIPIARHMQQAVVQLCLNKNGTIHTLKILQSSENVVIDNFLLHLFKDASSSFPPVPSSFQDNPYQLPFFNIEHLESFQSAQGWYINNKKS